MKRSKNNVDPALSTKQEEQSSPSSSSTDETTTDSIPSAKKIKTEIKTEVSSSSAPPTPSNALFNTLPIIINSNNNNIIGGSSNNNNRIRIAYNPDDIEIYLLWRSNNDTSDDTKEKNWKRVHSTFVPSFSSSIHQQYMSHLEELNSSSTNSIRIGVMCKNKTNVNIALKFELDGKDYAFMSTTLKPMENRLIRRLIHKTTKVSQTIQVKRNQVVESSSSASEQSLIEKLGTIKIKVFRIQVATEQISSSLIASEQNMIKAPEIKIREGMTKMKDLSVSFGTTNNAQSFQQTGFAYKEEIKTVEFIYHTRLGYLFELRKAGIDIGDK